MSLRPRFGDGGLLRRPLGVHGEPDDREPAAFEIIGTFAPDRDWDPFERTPAGLLLAEDFARVDLDDFETATAWYLEHGILDLRDAFPGEAFRASVAEVPAEEFFHDDRLDVLEQQANVAWILLTLARLSGGPEMWDPRWLSCVLARAGHFRKEADHFLGIEVVDADALTFTYPDEPLSGTPPTMWVPSRQWHDVWTYVRAGGEDMLHIPVPITPSYAGHVELVRRLMEPHVRIAARFEVEMPWPGAEYPMLVRERRRWRSVLSPIYLQLLEGLRRITEGQRGAGFCRECGQPFLTLDARRSSFCTDKHRFRFSQRERRKRVERERAAREAAARLDSRSSGSEERQR